MNFSQFQKRHKDQLEAASRLRDKWLAEQTAREGPLAAGDLVFFPVDLAPPLQWIAITPHESDADLWWFVPADIQPLAGTTDVVVSAGETHGELTVRCGHGVWIRAERCDLRRRVGQIPAESVKAILGVQRAMFHGGLKKTDQQQSVQDSPEYLDYFLELESAVERLRNWGRPIVIRAADFQSNWQEKIPGGSVFEQIPLKQAAAGGLFGEIVGEKSATSQTTVGAVLSQFEGPGTLVVTRIGEDRSAALLFLPSSEHDTPPRMFQEQLVGEWDELTWRKNPRGVFGSLLNAPTEKTYQLRLHSNTGPLISIELSNE